VGLSLVIAVMTHRHIVQPLEQLEGIVHKVRTTKDYSLRSDYGSRDEIGELATAFNDMLSELASAREREAHNQAELARVARLTTMGTMAGSIAHEINQPLAAIVTNSNAAVRWLSTTPPDLGEVRAALARIAGDGRRASEVVGGIRALFRNDVGAAAPLAVNDLVLEALDVLQGELRSQGVSVRTELARDLPPVAGHRVQLQQVVINLVVNAVEAMKAVPPDSRQLLVRSETAEAERVLVAVEDSGPGIEPKSIDRIFNAFYTTKEQGTGMGLAICRTIVEAHGGRLWASARHPAGSIFRFALPTSSVADA
jgi:C4-dicarboxylate-specific signal transduction histidine kinase